MPKEYKIKNETILWDPDKCIHSAVCVKGLPNVFQPKDRPWIKTDGATEDEIVQQVQKCPSGALSIKGK